MDNFIFDLQRFVEQTITAGGEPITIDGVTYTAVDADAVLNLDDDNKVSGLASGKVTAVVSGAETSPTVTFDATEGAITFTATSDGKVITSSMVLPLEIISGEFTFNGGALSITAGSKLAIVTTNGDYSLRNENTFVYDSTYTFSGASMTSDSQRVISHFVLSDGTTTRELDLEQLGKVINNFSERGFTLVKGSSEVMNIGDYSITATAVDNDAGLNISLGTDGITLVPNHTDGAVHVALSRGEQEIFAGDLECTSGTITFGFDKAVTFAAGTSFNFTWNGYTSTVTTTATATTDIALTDTGLSFTPHDGDGALGIVIRKDDSTIFGGTLNVTGGTISFDASEQEFSFTKGTKIALSLGTDGSQEMDFEIVDKDASFKVEADTEGNFTITPNSDDGSIDVTLKRDGETVFQNNVSVNGSMIVNPVTNLLTLTNGTTVTATFNDYTLTATASGNASSTMSLTASGISITPQTGDEGKLNITLTGTSSGSLSADIEVLSGGFLFGLDGALSVTAGTELQIKFSDNYIINFTADKTAGGAISLGTDGITFAPGSDDGGLQLSITRDGQTRSASLDVTGGSVTYKLDGSISLTEGTVVKNVFEDGNILTITANTAASGSITFNPQTGLTITPSTADALTVSLQTGDLKVVNISSITGSITYSNGIVTASDGTKARIKYYFDWESDLYTTGGTASLQFTTDRTVYTANEGANFVIDYLDGITAELQNGSYADIYGENVEDYTELIYEGTTFKCNDEEVVFTLEKAGNYNLNGMDITTSSDGVEVQLSNYNTVTFAADAGITFDGNTFSGGGTVSIIDGKISIDNNLSDTLITGTVGDDSIINTGTSVTINALGGNDFIINDVDSSVTAEEYGNSISAGEGNDTIYNYHSYNPTIESGAGDDLIVVSRGHKTFIDGGEGNDSIIGELADSDTSNNWRMGGYATILGGDGDDYINPGYSDNSSINGGDGNDTIINDGASTTINGGDGDDFISLGSESAVIQYATGEGNDTIEGFNENSTLSIGEDIYSTSVSGDDLIITVGESKITLKDAATLSAPNIESTNPVVQLIDMILKRTALGYPVMAGRAFHPTEYHGDEPTNYSAKEDWTITSADDLELHAVCYTPENSNDKWVVIVHGYGHNHKHMYPFATSYLANGYNVLMIDQRTGGDSEGTWLTMGAAESQDVALWTQEIARRNSNAKITLHGVSMGSATAMLAASRSDAVNVTALVEDCGYTSAMDVFYLLNEAIVDAPTEVIAAMDPVGKGITGYYLHDAAPIDSISSAKMPTLFITGDADTVVPVSMLTSLYEASGAEVKETFIAEGVEHGRAALVDSIGYGNTVFRFIAEANGEGWNTANTTDDISLRGTKYDDTISTSGSNVTINTGAGDDSIINSGSNVLFQYSEGDGNDTIVGFNENSTLNISSNGYYSVKSGDDLILNVGSDKITLVGAASLESVNVTGTYESKIPTSTEDIVEEMTSSYDYGTPITDTEEVATLIESKELDGDMALLLENESVDFSKYSGSKNVTLAGGKNQNIKFNKEGSNVAVINSDAVGKKNVSLTGGDLAVVEDTGAKVNLTASTGNDTIVSTGENVFVKMNSKGKTDILTTSGKMAVEGYDPSTDSGFGTNYEDILTAINDGGIVLSKGKLTIDSAIIDGVNNLANIFDADGDMQKVGDAAQDEALDLSKETADLIVTVNENSTATSGKGDDTIFADAGSHIDAGEGKNYIQLEERGANEDGAEIVVRSGKNTIANFTAGFDDTSDRLFVGVNDTVDFKFDGTDLKAYTNDKLRGVVSEVGDGASFVNFLVADNNSTSKNVAMQEGATVTVEDEIADLYVGKKSGVDFNNYEENLYINLGSEETSIGGGEVLFSGINQITVGSGLNTLMGSFANETLTGNADGVTEFVFNAGGGRDVIQNFNFDVDKISVGAAVTSVNMNEAGGVRLQLGDDILTLEDAKGKIFKINEFAALVDENITYDAEANYFVATSKKASVTVNEGAEIWLDGSHGKTFVGDIKTLDASNSEDKNILAGNDLDNTIIGGSLENSLWGGNGGDDLLQGGTGKNMFFYALGNGNDTITGANDGDVVYLSNVTLEQLAATEITQGSVRIDFADGGKLNVETSNAVEFVLNNETYIADHEAGTWQKK